MIPGEILTPDGTIELGPGRARVKLAVENTGDRPIQVGSHYHFAAANPALSLRPRRGPGVPAGHPGRDVGAVRAGLSREVPWSRWPGARVVPGLRPESARTAR